MKAPAGAVVPDAESRSYYGHPVIKPPVWKPEIPWYFFTGGLAGASSTLAAFAGWSGGHPVARVARRVAAGAAVASPVLLISDLGVPSRFLHMLRMVKVTSPMNVGSWILTAYGPAAVGAAVLSESGAPPALRKAADAVAATLGPLLASYTAGLVANTAVPVWHDARHTLPFSFVGGSMTSAGALAAALVPPPAAGPARRLALTGVALEAAATTTMERRLGDAARPYHEGAAGRLSRAAKVLTAGGAALLASSRGRRRAPAVAGAALLLGGQACHRWSVFRAGFQSAADPAQTVGPQRRRLARRG